MFRALAKKVFSTSNKKQFYLSLLESDSNRNAPTTQEKSGINYQFNNTLTKSKPAVELCAEDAIKEGYYDFLFGVKNAEVETDELAKYVAENIEELLCQPDQLLQMIPVLPTSLSQLLAQLQSKNFDTEVFLALLQKEPVVAARVIELANSSHYNRSQKQITDLKSALLMLGVQGLSEGVINGFVHRLIPQSHLYFRFYGKRIWESSLTSGELTKSLLLKSNHSELASQGYLLGLISNLGDIIIYQLLADAFNVVHPDCQPNSVLFRQCLVKHSKRFSFVLARKWQFPKMLTDALAMQTQIKSTKQSKANADRYPLAIYLYEARLLTKLKLQLQYNQISEQEFEQQAEKLTLTRSAQAQLEQMVALPTD